MCGYNKCIAALDFHHLDPNAKEGGIIGTTASLEKQREEAKKCILVCANCHREIHAGVRSIQDCLQSIMYSTVFAISFIASRRCGC